MKLFPGIFVLGLGSLLASACGGSEAGVAASTGGPSTVDASAPADPPATDGGKAKAESGNDSKDDRIDPIEVGRSWTYDVKVLGFFPACASGSFSASAVSQSTIAGKPAVRVDSFCKGAGAYDYSVDGDRVYSYLANVWRTSLDSPVAEGHTWTDGFLDYRWESAGSVRTPAGTFSNCWQATTVASYTSYIVLCRGVGPVHWHYDTGFGNGYDAILTAKNF